MLTFFKLVLLTLLTHGVISGEIAINDPIVVPTIIHLVEQMDNKDEDN